MRPPPEPIDWEVTRRPPPPESLWRAAWEVVKIVFTGKGNGE